MKPQDIEDLSFRIIDEEAGDHGFDEQKWSIVRRMIHTSADFDYIKSVRFHPEALQKGIDAIKNGCTIITDTNMARVGIRKKEISRFGGDVRCLIADENVARQAIEEKTTRALAAVDIALPFIENGIYVVGNAPTALLRLIEHVKAGKVMPALIVGLPVGFVNAAESKDALMELDIPFISNKGRKGGSNVAASIINALLIMADSSEKPK
ncbi:Cobalt-precorrin-8X methylmutase [Desulfamplus magnetovallimortis]|uniref:Cobalt-precorrin-8X methylmutase n=1 Tax=Desulfamplus magnetovallimortis TaxID=1246637 RepID=A0A1W1HA26_9BACT|nr:precorrin-8X methylmutase [Desulfamplus magnetovallimortis]SLM29340.1 Cobalt-precorrin-8X methylmutase [Desulfamplus magnetovallimortis]